MRSDEDDGKRLDPHFPLFNVFAVRNLETNYTEGLLRALLLRSVATAEWGLKVQPGALASFLGGIVGDPDQDVVLGELLLAMARGAVDRSVVTQRQSVFERYLGDASGVVLKALLSF